MTARYGTVDVGSTLSVAPFKVNLNGLGFTPGHPIDTVSVPPLPDGRTSGVSANHNDRWSGVLPAGGSTNVTTTGVRFLLGIAVGPRVNAFGPRITSSAPDVGTSGGSVTQCSSLVVGGIASRASASDIRAAEIPHARRLWLHSRPRSAAASFAE